MLFSWRLSLWLVGGSSKSNRLISEAKAAATLRTTGPVAVAIGVAGPRAIAQTLDAVGTIQSPYTVKISPKIQGLIDYLQVREGDPVKAGQVLIKLDPDTLNATVQQNVANVAMAKAAVRAGAIHAGIRQTYNLARRFSKLDPPLIKAKQTSTSPNKTPLAPGSPLPKPAR